MSFASISFLFFFFPLAVSFYFLTPAHTRNAYLVLASVFFYAWSGGAFLIFLILSALFNYALALFIERSRDTARRVFLIIGIAANLGALGYYKYAAFIAETLGLIPYLDHAAQMSLRLALPLGISFFTFHAISYLIDVYRRDISPQRNLIDLYLYLFFFPQLIAGPIIRYKQIAGQLRDRAMSAEKFAHGVWRFSIGLGKKVLLANSLAPIADAAFGAPMGGVSASAAWLGIVAYSLQLYYDFSGYSDMAIGIAAMFGFTFPENFDYPYVARSIREFWRRWHMSLSAWFRDYVYIPLGGSRKDIHRTCANLFLVFLLVGLWHGASWTFVAWGAWHGFWIVLERLLRRFEIRVPKLLQHVYALGIILVGWIFFRTESFASGMAYLGALSGFSAGAMPITSLHVDSIAIIALASGLLGAFPLKKLFEKIPPLNEQTRAYVKTAVCVSLILASAMTLADSAYNPFIYYHF